jgi:hypothetical protein
MSSTSDSAGFYGGPAAAELAEQIVVTVRDLALVTDPEAGSPGLCQGTRGTARRRSRVLPSDGHESCPLMATSVLAGQVKGVTPCPARAWLRRTLSPLVWQTWAWWSSRSTVAVARVLGMSSSNAPGCRLEETATERFS